MERMEQELRASLARVVESPPTVPVLSENIIQRGRRVRRRRLAVAGAAVAAVVVAAGLFLIPTRHPVAEPARLTPRGAPTVAMTYGKSPSSAVVVWPGPERHVVSMAGTTPLATVPGGLLRVSGRDLELVPENSVRRTLVTQLNSERVAVSADGRRVVVVTFTGGGRRQLQEVDVASGRVLRSVPVGPPLVAGAEPLNPAFYSGDAVMLDTGDGVVRWEPGNDQVVGAVEGYTKAIGGGRQGALAMSKPDTCDDIGTVRTRFKHWTLCGEDFRGVSPDGASVLVLSKDLRSVTVNETGDGDVRRTLDLPAAARAIGWEDDDTFLYTTAGEPQNTVVRCVVSTGGCLTVERVGDDLPVPLPDYGS
jgi:hypothetical protein